MHPDTTEPALRYAQVNGVRLAYWERGTPRADLPTLFFVHATGFHGRVFDRVIEAFPDHHSICLEQRGHGRSDKVKTEHWRVQGQDLVAVVSSLELSDLIGIGHSMGGHATVDAAAASGRFARLVLLDPTISAPEAYASQEMPAFEGGLHPAAHRKNDFASWEEMRERLLPKGAYHLWEPRVLDDYCRYGLVQKPGGRFELACPPEVEASIYMTARSNGGIYESVRKLAIPVTIVRAMERSPDHPPTDFSASPTWPGLVNDFPNAREIHLPDCTHFIPMQMPDEVIRVLREEVRAWVSIHSGIEV